VKAIEATEIERRLQALEEINLATCADEKFVPATRLATLEAKSGIGADPSLLIIWRIAEPNGQFGRERCEADSAEADGQVWRREPGETSQDFENRVTANLPKREHFATRVTFYPAE